MAAKRFLLGCAIPLFSLCGSLASAATVWTDWTAATTGANGSATGSVSGVGVSYSGEVIGAAISGNFAGWAPNSSFIGGTSTTSPSTVGEGIALTGVYGGTRTVTFASPVVDPLIAIWSLGQPGSQASFTFNATPTLEAGGPNSQYGGASIGVSGNVVSGSEGNGVVQFTGTFSSLSWTNTFENYYVFTVGINGVANGDGGGTVPEPGTLALLGLGLAGLAATRRRKH